MSNSINPADVRIFSGQSHQPLAVEIAEYLKIPLEKTYFGRFSNDNLNIQLGASVRGRAVYIIQSLVEPVSDHLLELFMMLDIARSAGAHEVHAIIPYFSYARSDKKDAPRISITARLIADLLQSAGATHVMTMTLHSPQVHGFFTVPTDPLTARGLFVHYLKKKDFNKIDTIVVSPDMGRANAAARFADRLGLPVAAAEKTRRTDDEVDISDSIIRQVKGYQRALIYDDEIATGATVFKLAAKLKKSRIKEIIVICTHAVFSKDALPRLAAEKRIMEIVTTNTIPPKPGPLPAKLTILSVGPIFGEAIRRNYNRQSIGDLFTFSQDKIKS